MLEKILCRGTILSKSFSLAETLGKQKTRKGQIYVFVCFLFKDVINNHNCLGGYSLRLHPTALCSYTPGGSEEGNFSSISPLFFWQLCSTMFRSIDAQISSGILSGILEGKIGPKWAWITRFSNFAPKWFFHRKQVCNAPFLAMVGNIKWPIFYSLKRPFPVIEGANRADIAF